MTSAQVIDLKGKKVREVELSHDVFDITPNKGAMHSALVRQLANARAGTASTKTRSEVSGGGRKPWRQKGTGRARAGSIRSPLWEGGGVTFGPKPRDFSVRMPKKVRILAIKSALAARRDNLVVVESFDGIKDGKTKEMAGVYKALKIEGKKVALVLDYACEHCQIVERSARNIEGTKVLHINNLNVKDLMNCEVLLTTERTLEAINHRFQSTHKCEGAAKEKTKATSKAEKPKAAKSEAKAKKSEGEEPKAAKKTTAKKAESEGKSAKPKTSK
ncbi:MAG TPA: 50S ribosomal protein L4 [Candidatus Obscuribacterales bacterium]